MDIFKIMVPEHSGFDDFDRYCLGIIAAEDETEAFKKFAFSNPDLNIRFFEPWGKWMYLNNTLEIEIYD